METAVTLETIAASIGKLQAKVDEVIARLDADYFDDEEEESTSSSEEEPAPPPKRKNRNK